jgi:large conductance mechanosensitive channel
MDAAQAAGAVTINYGVFINTLISFVIVSFAVFLLIKGINKLRADKKEEDKQEEATTKECPHCFTQIDIRATKCPNCTSDI